MLSFDLHHEILKQRKSLFLWSPVAMGAGIVSFFHYDGELSWVSLGSVFLILMLVVSKSVHSYAKTGRDIWLSGVIAAIALLLFTIGFMSAQWRTQSLNTPLLDKELAPLTIEATIDKIVALDGGKAKRVVLSDIKFVDDQADIPLSKIRLRSFHFKGDTWKTGDRITVRAKLRPPSGPVMPGGFDFRFKAYYEGLSTVGYTLGDATLVASSHADSNQIQHFRSNIASRLYQSMPPEVAGIAQALLTGERAGIKSEDTEALRIAGLAHLLAISGLHIGLVAGCMFFFVRLLLALIPGMALYHPIKKYAAVCAIITAFFYMILAGATVPTVRAFIMTSLVLLAVILDRSALNMRLVALAAMIVMLTTPEAVIGPSFVLSFAAVAALIVFYQGAGREWLTNARSFHPLWRPIYYVLGVVATTIIATLATAPFSVMFFNRFAVYSVIANIGAMPLMAFIVMPFGLVSTLLIPTVLDVYLWPVMAWGIAEITKIAHVVAGYDGADLYLPSFGVIDTIMIAAGFLWLLLWQGVLRWIGLVMVIAAFMIPHIAATPKIMISDRMEAIFIVDKTRDKSYIIGKGSRYLRENWLGSLGIKPSVDILSYQDGDKIDHDLGQCDDFWCHLRVNDNHIGVVFNPAALRMACQTVDLVIAKFPVKRRDCRDTDIIDRFYIWRHGPTTISFDQQGYQIESVRQDRE